MRCAREAVLHGCTHTLPHTSRIAAPRLPPRIAPAPAPLSAHSQRTQQLLADLLGRALVLAGKLKLAVDDVMRFDALPDQPPSFDRDAMPAYIAEWASSHDLCMVRFM